MTRLEKQALEIYNEKINCNDSETCLKCGISIICLIYNIKEIIKACKEKNLLLTYNKEDCRLSLTTTHGA